MTNHDTTQDVIVVGRVTNQYSPGATKVGNGLAGAFTAEDAAAARAKRKQLDAERKAVYREGYEDAVRHLLHKAADLDGRVIDLALQALPRNEAGIVMEDIGALAKAKLGTDRAEKVVDRLIGKATSKAEVSVENEMLSDLAGLDDALD